MQVRCFTVGMFQVNTYLVTDPATGASAIVDTGETEELRDANRNLLLDLADATADAITKGRA